MNIFVTGTDTDVGKTVITAGLAAAMRNYNKTVGVFKPVQTGASCISSDCEFVKSVDAEIITKVSYNFKEPVAPSLAAELDKEEIDLEKIKKDYEALKNQCDFVIVEGAGGLLVPIKNNFLMRDLAKMLNLPLVIVARPDLGTINHTLLTVEAAKDLDILGIIISGYPEGTEDLAIKNAPSIIEKLSGEKILGILPRIENLDKNPSVLKEIFPQKVELKYFHDTF
jgi:dethiobiotin synthetase